LINTTIAFGSYWRFATERMAIFQRRLDNQPAPWTDDPILRSYRFTNVYRATDRVSQYLIREVQYRSDRSQAPDELFFRTLLFKIFNKIDTWEAIEIAHGPIAWQSIDLGELDCTLTSLFSQRKAIYSAAYIMPAPPFGQRRKHSNHLALLSHMMADQLASRMTRARTLSEVYELILAYPGLGKFLAFQYAIDLNYSQLLNFEESEFVVAGPGALDGISKCFSETGGRSPEWLIRWMAERQDVEFRSRDLKFDGLFGRPLQPIDCQNLFCEISKYTRVAHPELAGIADRQRIKQSYQRNERPLEPLAFPPRWNLKVPLFDASSQSEGPARQQLLL
jgi:alpha-glutamyl/putrescinyl thymine pyrophosphorylase clade 1